MGMRLDAALVQRGLAASRERAKDAVRVGRVLVNGAPAAKPSAPVEDGDVLEVTGPGLRYVGRGGLKLEKALQAFGLDLAGKTCADIGASTGGFTDCMLQAGAARVLAVDVGHGQLAETLQRDPRVTNLEGVDARDVTAALLGGTVQFAAADVSFISLQKVLGAIAGALEDGASAVCLVKPQFEAGRGNVGKKGVVRSPQVHTQVLQRVLGYAHDAGLQPAALDFSPITGPEGNIEYLLLVEKRAASAVGTGRPEAAHGIDSAEVEGDIRLAETAAGAAHAGRPEAVGNAASQHAGIDIDAVVSAAHAAHRA